MSIATLAPPETIQEQPRGRIEAASCKRRTNSSCLVGVARLLAWATRNSG